MPAAGYRLADGSGLSYANRLSAGAIAKLLRVMAAPDVFGVYCARALDRRRDGTLPHRMRGTPAQDNLHGKTGTLNIASCLSGYVTTSAGHGVVFAMLTNGAPVNVWSAQRAQDAHRRRARESPRSRLSRRAQAALTAVGRRLQPQVQPELHGVGGAAHQVAHLRLVSRERAQDVVGDHVGIVARRPVDADAQAGVVGADQRA